MPEVKACIFCDDIRTESSGKIILIGTYLGHMVVTQFPWQGTIAVLMIVEGVGEKARLEIALGTAGGAEFLRAEAEVGLLPGATQQVAYLPLPPVPVSISGADTIELKVGFDGGEMRVVGTVGVAKGEIGSQ